MWELRGVGYGALLSQELQEASRKLKDLRRKAKITPDKTASAASASGIPDNAMDMDEPEQPINISISSHATPEAICASGDTRF
ncbi:hypothetical protein FA95DRAFT_1604433 [Auriscalpium vulgare]|uniref:Uncharacterized protein n=1 Tax=Auriscalpium vulgare TaxID=40419 RepID=A0ACB8S0U1_9AGAM|nr:hypothetical protein FA95DRAFT_1604433 [Auriscalpium vulgare]